MNFRKLILEKAKETLWFQPDMFFPNDPNALTKFQMVYAESKKMEREGLIEVYPTTESGTGERYVAIFKLKVLKPN